MGTFALDCKQLLAYMSIGLLGRVGGFSPFLLGCSVEEFALIKASSTPCRFGWDGVGAGFVTV